jgi:hypothetical protein
MLGRHLPGPIDEAPRRIGKNSPELSIGEGERITSHRVAAVVRREGFGSYTICRGPRVTVGAAS